MTDQRPAADEVRQNAFDALLYGSERWDGDGYPEGRRGVAIPRVARAFAVCRGFREGNGSGVDRLRAEASHEYDPRMVQRFASMVRTADRPARLVAVSHRPAASYTAATHGPGSTLT